MRKTSRSSKYFSITFWSSRAEARSWPNGFSMISRTHPCAARRLPTALHDGLEDARRRREVVDAVPLRLALLVELRERLGEPVLALLVGEVHRDVAHAAREQLPDVVAELVA